MDKILRGFFLTVNCAAALAFSVSSAPMISVDSADFDMGVIKEGTRTSIKHTFVVKNTGNEALIIEKVRPG
ncbi:MAG: DUF1573 domain-containing protein [Chitinispirillaceae bacterium]|nr:DUF1573 domain-containing protein [Chitinispirillaceae bacterium]